MSKINELIKELCPNGVEFKTIGELCETITDYVAAGSFADIAKNVKYLDTPNYAQLIRTTDIKSKFKNNNFIYVDENAFNYLWRVNLNKESIILPNIGNCGEVYFLKPEDLPYKNNVLATNAILVRSNKINNKYLSYVFQGINFQIQLKRITSPAGQTKFNKTDLKKLKVPVPPIEVQEEIVRILDKFSELEAELEAELEVRNQQYEYYQDKLFEFRGDTQKVKLSDVLISLKTGLNPRIFFQLNTEGADGYYVTVREIGTRQVKYWEAKDKVNQEGLNRINERSNLEINDVLFSGTGTIGRVSLIEEEPKQWNVKEGVYILKPIVEKINPIFLMYLMKSNYMKKIYSNYIVGSPVASIPMRDLKNVEFDLPNMKEQVRIVKILDRFDKLCNDITDGLPAEIELRRKQYEYYRNKLFDFKEVSANE